MPRISESLSARPPGSLPDLGCACATIRRAARLVTQLYSHEMGATIEPAQFSLLVALSKRPDAGQSRLARALGLDKTTMSRNLKVMEKNGWIEASPASDRREHGIRLTALGRKTVTAAEPGWNRAQDRLRAALKPGEWERMLKTFGRAAEAALEAESGTDPRL